MKVLLQRVKHASVTIDGQCVSQIGAGLLVFLGVEQGDDEMVARALSERVLHYRVFADSQGKMNLNVQQSKGEVLVVSQFTLTADTRKGRRPSFTPAASPEEGERLYECFLAAMRERGNVPVAQGRFGADMQVALVNDGPVTFMLCD